MQQLGYYSKYVSDVIPRRGRCGPQQAAFRPATLKLKRFSLLLVSRLGFFGPHSLATGTIRYWRLLLSFILYLSLLAGCDISTVLELYGDVVIVLLQASITHDTRLITLISYGDNKFVVTMKHEFNSAVGFNIENLNSSVLL